MRTRVVDAVILAGGASSRMNGVAKPLLTIGASTLLDIALDATDFCRRIVVVGPPDLAGIVERRLRNERIDLTREDPPRTGPVHALAAGLHLLRGLAEPEADAVIVLAADLPEITMADLLVLSDAVVDRSVDVVLAEHNGRAQPLVAAWRPIPLAVAVDAIGDTRDRAIRRLLTPGFPRIELPHAADCDTPEDLQRARLAQPPDLNDVAAIVRAGVPVLAPRSRTPVAAIGAVLAEPLIAAVPFPSSDRSAMDGYAVRGRPPWRISSGVQAAGDPAGHLVEPGTAIRITTGAVVPSGADAVHRDEYVEIDGDHLGLDPSAPIRNDIRRSGEDWPVGAILAPAGLPVTPALASVALSAELSQVLVRGPVRARLAMTGDEIRPTRAGQSHLTTDSVGPVLSRFLASVGIVIETVDYIDDETPHRMLPDSPDDHDLTIVVGATGFGVRDGLRTVLDSAGATTMIGRVRSRPGGSQVVARLPQGHVVLGLPGNPYAAVVTALWTGGAIAAAMTGMPLRRRRGRLAEGVNPAVPAGVDRLLPATVDETGRWRVTPSVRTATLLDLSTSDAIAVVRFGRRDIEVLELPRG